ncbi:MAG: T9SS type A sorting domain-containing protein [Chitinophagaceae bacterium]
MKKFLCISLLVCFFFQSRAQTKFDFENWHLYSILGHTLHIPNGWYGTDSFVVFYGSVSNPFGTFNSQVNKELPGANSTSTAIKVETKNQDAITGFTQAGPIPCMVSNAEIILDASLSFGFDGGMPFLTKPVSASFWIKNNPVQGDTTRVSILAIDNSDGEDSLVAHVDTLLYNSISNWTQINMPFTYVSTSLQPTLLRIIISSAAHIAVDTANAFVGVHDGTYIVIDEMEITSPLGVHQVNGANTIEPIIASVFQETLTLQNMSTSGYTFALYDIQGNKVLETILASQEHQRIPIGTLSSGLYIYAVSDERYIVQNNKIIIP